VRFIIFIKKFDELLYPELLIYSVLNFNLLSTINYFYYYYFLLKFHFLHLVTVTNLYTKMYNILLIPF